MNRWVYNCAIGAGVALVGAGVSLWHLPAGLAATGALILALTLYGARVAGGRG